MEKIIVWIMPYLDGKYSIFNAYLIRYELKSLNAFLIFLKCVEELLI